VLAYLAGLTPDRSRRVMRGDLATIAALLLGVDPDGGTPDDRWQLVFDVPWHELQIARTNLIHARLLERGLSANTINRMLSALRGVLKACWQQELMSAELSTGRALSRPSRATRCPLAAIWAMGSGPPCLTCARRIPPLPGRGMPPCWPVRMQACGGLKLPV
jgi:hypothetical protein